MSVANWINSRERQDVDGKDAGECFLDVCGSVLIWRGSTTMLRAAAACTVSTMRNSLHPSRDREI